MVLGWTNGDNSVIKGLINKINLVESRVTLLKAQYCAQKEE